VKLTGGLRLIAVLIKVFEDIDSNGQRAAGTRLGIIRMLAGYEEILQKKMKKVLSRQTSVLDFFKSLSDTRTSPPALLNTEDNNP
jgi:hypothetical protein